MLGPSRGWQGCSFRDVTTLLLLGQPDELERVCAEMTCDLTAVVQQKPCVHLGGLPAQKSISIIAYALNWQQKNLSSQRLTTHPTNHHATLVSFYDLVGRAESESDKVGSLSPSIWTLAVDASLLSFGFFSFQPWFRVEPISYLL